MDYQMLRRDIVGDVTSAPDTFTSWNKCMSKSYCKWPAIVGIVIGSLILFSVLYCLGRCLCCGVSCAQMLCCCCRGGGGGRSRERPSRHKDDYTHMPPTPYSGYQPAPSPMAYQHNAAPQFATFDVSSNRKIHEDSLPAMPSWDTAHTRRVEDFSEQPHEHHEDVEMGNLPPHDQHQYQPQQRTARGGYNQVPAGPPSPAGPDHDEQSAYFAGAPAYNADIGAQRMGHGHGYSDSQHTPLSPAPTYHSVAPATDRFAAGALSPTPHDYNRGYQPSLSTRYEATDYPASTAHMPYHQSSRSIEEPPESYGYAVPSPKEQRPPSLLQVGRRPVPGSLRDI